MGTPITPGVPAFVPTGGPSHPGIQTSPEVSAAMRATSALLNQNVALANAGQLPPEPGTPGAIPVTPVPAAPAPTPQAAPQATPPAQDPSAQPYIPWIAPTTPATQAPAPVAPVPTQAAPATVPPSQTPEGAPAASPGEPATSTAAQPFPIDPNTLTPEGKLLWAQVNGDSAQFVQRLLEQTGTVAPTVEPEIQIPPPPPVDPAQLQSLAQQHLNSIPEYRQRDQQFAQFKQEHVRLVGDPISQTPGFLQQKEWELSRVNIEMEVPEVKENPVRLADLRTKADALDREITRITTRASALDTQMRDSLQYHNSMMQQTVNTLLERYESAHTERETQAALSNLQGAYQDQMAAEWPTAITEAATRYNIDPQTLDRYARAEALAHLEQGIAVEHTRKFVDNFAKGYRSDMDRSHRAVSAEYGSLAAQRAAGVSGAAPQPGQVAVSPSITPAAATPATPAPDNRPLAQIIRDRENAFKSEVRSARTA